MKEERDREWHVTNVLSGVKSEDFAAEGQSLLTPRPPRCPSCFVLRTHKSNTFGTTTLEGL